MNYVLKTGIYTALAISLILGSGIVGFTLNSAERRLKADPIQAANEEYIKTLEASNEALTKHVKDMQKLLEAQNAREEARLAVDHEARRRARQEFFNTPPSYAQPIAPDEPRVEVK